MSTSPWKLIGSALACAGLTVGALAAASGTRDVPVPAQEPPPPRASPEFAKQALRPPPAKSAEDRLSEVERKLDRLIGLMERTEGEAAPPPVPPSRPPSSSISGVGAAIGLTPPPTPAESRNLREIEAQLVTVHRKYQIVQEYVGKSNDMISQLQAQSLREDAVAPARILVARLREMEEEAEDDEARVRSRLKGCEDELAEAGKAREGEEKTLAAAKDDLVKGGRTQKEIDDLLDAMNRPLRGPGAGEGMGGRAGFAGVDRDLLMAIAPYRSSLGRLRGLKASESTAEERRKSALKDLAAKEMRTKAIRRLITWAKDRFQDVELTIDQAAPAAK